MQQTKPQKTTAKQPAGESIKAEEEIQIKEKVSVLDRAKIRMIGQKPLDKTIDYLTPMRYHREYAESLKGASDLKSD